MSKTEDNLKMVFAGKSQTNQKYRIYAKKAKREGLPNIARLFKLTSEAEKIQAEGNLFALTGIGSTMENLKIAIAGKINKYKRTYPEMVKQAESDNHKAKALFEKAVKLDEVHARLYLQAFDALKKGKDFNQDEFYLCPFCGNIKTGKPEKNCDICEGAMEKFIRVGDN
ncbi:MAG: ferritin family protein [Ignavibacteriaceae bacterium]